MINAVGAWDATIFIFCIGSLINTLEWFALLRSRYTIWFTTWSVTKNREHRILFRFLDLFTPVLDDRIFPVVLLAKPIVLVAIAVAVLSFEPSQRANGLITALLAAVCLTNLAPIIRSPYGHDGADQMWLLGSIALFLGNLSGREESRTLALFFIGAQLMAAYLVSGAAKLLSDEWRRGIALRNALSTHVYGNRRLGRYLEYHPGVSLIASWAIIGFQIAAPLAILLGPNFALVYLCLGLVFHMCIFVTMGLLSFLLAFPIGYPGFLLLSAETARWLTRADL